MKIFQIGLMGVSFVVSASALGAAGELDESFGFNGSGKAYVSFDLGGNGADTPRSMALDPGGNIVVGGSASTNGGSVMAVARLKADGAPDETFNVNTFDYRWTYSPPTAGANGVGLVATSNGPCLAGRRNGSFSSTAHTACLGTNQNRCTPWALQSKYFPGRRSLPTAGHNWATISFTSPAPGASVTTRISRWRVCI